MITVLEAGSGKIGGLEVGDGRQMKERSETKTGGGHRGSQ